MESQVIVYFSLQMSLFPRKGEKRMRELLLGLGYNGRMEEKRSDGRMCEKEVYQRYR